MKLLLLISILTLAQAPAADAPSPSASSPSPTAVPLIVEPPENSTDVICEFCGMVNCTMPGHGGANEVAPADEQPSVMTHPGIPLWMAMGGVIGIIALSHVVITRTHTPGKSYKRFDLLKLPFAKSLIATSWFPMLMQGGSIALFALVIYAGLFGSQRTFPVANIAPVLTWNIWWSLLIFFILIGGSLFCVICPWEGVASIVTALSPRSRIKKLGYEMKWPKWAANIYPAMILFILLTWFELGMDITKSPLKTAYMAIAFVALAVLIAILFEKRAFCRHLCLVGRIQGLYSMFSPVELRPRSADACRTCEGKECYNGSETATGCHLSLYPAALNENTYCTLCTECIRACPSDNLTLNLRPLATDLYRKLRFRWDEAIFAVVLLALTSFHGLTMTPTWIRFTDLLRVQTGATKTVVFTVLMTFMILWPVALFWITAAASQKCAAVPNVSTARIFKAFAYSVIPIALFYHLAHNGMHFFMEAQHLLPIISDPFGYGWDLFGTAHKAYPPLMTLRSIWWLQIFLILTGHLYGVVVSDRIARQLFTDRKQSVRALIPLLITMVLYSGFSIWLIAQPMEMRSGM